jgi:hypothetical protein
MPWRNTRKVLRKVAMPSSNVLSSPPVGVLMVLSRLLRRPSTAPTTADRPPRSPRQLSRGQAIVEFVIVVPLILLLLLATIDFGRAFLGWVTLNNMARVGANYAALHASAWGTPGNAAQQAEYAALIDANKNFINCDYTTPPPPVFGATQDPGDQVRVTLTCGYAIATPFVQAVLGNVVALRASSSFPITAGCIANCGSGGGAPPPPPPPTDNCRDVPTMVDMSVAGARNAWVSAGFMVSNFSAPPNSDTRTVASASITPPADAEPCPSGKAFFAASVTVILKPLVTPKPTPTCLYVPNVTNVSVADARSAWTGAGFTGAFAPASGQDTLFVTGQSTSPPSQPGDCLEPDATMDVTYGPAPPAPPPMPCKVPSLVNTWSGTASTTWSQAGFSGPNLTFKGNTPYTIGSQTLVGNTYYSCDVAMSVKK